MGIALFVVTICCTLCGFVLSIDIGMWCSFLLFCIYIWFFLVCGLLCCVWEICLGFVLYEEVDVDIVFIVVLLVGLVFLLL